MEGGTHFSATKFPSWSLEYARPEMILDNAVSIKNDDIAFLISLLDATGMQYPWVTERNLFFKDRKAYANLKRDPGYVVITINTYQNVYLFYSMTCNNRFSAESFERCYKKISE